MSMFPECEHHMHPIYCPECHSISLNAKDSEISRLTAELERVTKERDEALRDRGYDNNLTAR